MSKNVDLMVDLETWGTSANACIVQIGACYFDRQSGEVFETFKMNVQPGSPKNGVIDAQTIEWWMQQSQEARDSIMAAPKQDLFTAITEFKKFASRANAIWSHATFDFVIIQEALKRLDERPFNYKFSRDIRTLTHLAPIVARQIRESTHHDALEDAKYQVKYCVACLNALKAAQ